jgi:hypothetical protein
MNAMTSVRVLVLAAVIATASAAANAQAPWPNSQPQTAWPSQPQAQPQQAPWPNSAPAPQPQPQQAPWPNSAPQAQPMAAPPMGGGGGFGGPPMGGGFGGGGGGGGPPPECMTQFTTLRAEVEKRGMAARTASEKHASREEMCKLVTEYGAAETKWIKYTEGNMSKCGIPKEIVAQLKTVHAKTADGQKKLCAAGPAAASAVPTLSDALGTATLPSRETEKKKRKPGGTMDTLTGNALGQ